MWCKETKNVHISYKIVTKTVKCLFAHEQHCLAVKLLRGFVHICGNQKSSPRFVSMFDRYRSHRERERERDGQTERGRVWDRKQLGGANTEVGINVNGRKEKSKVKGEMIKGMHVETVAWTPLTHNKKKMEKEKISSGSVHIKKSQTNFVFFYY